jgi:transposase, IS5 family
MKVMSAIERCRTAALGGHVARCEDCAHNQRASRNHALSQAQENANYQKSKVRARVEHVFGAQQTSPGGRIIRTIGIVRARAKIGLQNLAYNIRRFVTLERMAAA